MKFRPRAAASIANYFLFTLLWVNLVIYASEEKNTNVISPWETNIMTQDEQSNVKTANPFDSISKRIISTILNQFLTIREILILRQTCQEFAIVLIPNDENLVLFCNDFCSKKMDEVPLIWSDLKYFLDQSYANVFYKMEMFNVEKNIYAVLTGSRDKKVICWYNRIIPYPKLILFNKTKKDDKCSDKNKYELPKIYNETRSVLAKITKEGRVHFCGDKCKKEGNPSCFGENVKRIFSNWDAFAALLENGSVRAWGVARYGGKIPDEIQIQLQNVKMLFSTQSAFAALLHDGRVFAWGTGDYGGKIPDKIQIQLRDVKMIFSTQFSFAALLHGGRVVAWGDKNYGGKISDEIQNQLQNVKMIFSTYSAFVALLNDGCVVAWGDENYGGKILGAIQDQLKEVKMIFSNLGAFVALLEDGSVFAWGSTSYGGKIPNSKLINVTTIFPQKEGFTALYNNGDILTWPQD